MEEEQAEEKRDFSIDFKRVSELGMLLKLCMFSASSALEKQFTSRDFRNLLVGNINDFKHRSWCLLL